MEKPKTENLTAWITGRNLNIYQKADAVIEYNKLLEYVSDLENQSTSQKETIEGLKMSLENLYDAAFTAVSHVAVANYQSREIEAKNLIRTAYEQAEQLLKETEPKEQ